MFNPSKDKYLTLKSTQRLVVYKHQLHSENETTPFFREAFSLSQDLQPTSQACRVSGLFTLPYDCSHECSWMAVPPRLWDRSRDGLGSTNLRGKPAHIHFSVQDMTSLWPAVCHPDLTQHFAFPLSFLSCADLRLTELLWMEKSAPFCLVFDWLRAKEKTLECYVLESEAFFSDFSSTLLFKHSYGTGLIDTVDCFLCASLVWLHQFLLDVNLSESHCHFPSNHWLRNFPWAI